MLKNRETYLSPIVYSLLEDPILPLRGRKKEDAHTALVSAKTLIIKVKKMGIDTAEAEELYLEAKAQLKNKKYGPAMEGIEEAKKTVKVAYAKGIKGMLEIKKNDLDKKIKEMESRNLDTKTVKVNLKKAKGSLSGKVKELREGYKAAKDGLRLAESTLSQFNIVSGLIKSIQNLIRPISDYDPEISILSKYNERLDQIKKLVDEGKLKSAESEARLLGKELKGDNIRFLSASGSISALKKVIQDAEILEANIDYTSKFQEVHDLILYGRFTDASKIARYHTKEISSFLSEFREARHAVDLANEKVVEVKGWGFTAYEAEEALNIAKRALKDHEFEKVMKISQESREMAVSIRERHKQSLNLITKAKEELERFRSQGNQVQEIEISLSDAEDLFNRGDYGASMEKIDLVLKEINKED
jgi:hypothetical protein